MRAALEAGGLSVIEQVDLTAPDSERLDGYQ
jgi:hypothetical protein